MGVKLDIIKAGVFPHQVAAATRAYQRAAQRAAQELVEDHQQTTRTWTHQPRWTVRVSAAAITVTTSDRIYAYVDRGTRAHIIRPRRAKRLVFRTGYHAKTRPGSLLAGHGGATGPFVFSLGVHHPGTEARDFSGQLEKRWKRRWPSLLQAALHEALT